VAIERARLAEAEAARQAEISRAAQFQARAEAVNLAAQRSAEEEQSATGEDNAIRAAVVSVLSEQQEAWNRGDVDAFAEHYWMSGDLTFSSGGKMTRGWEETVRGYKDRYPTREKMGRLTFANLEITTLGDAAALVLGEWRLERDTGDTQAARESTGDTPGARGETLSGNFSLVFRKLDGRWVIVHDHTSRAAEPGGDAGKSE
jgi:beta-aspartyl-peptidase (threonine type)